MNRGKQGKMSKAMKGMLCLLFVALVGLFALAAPVLAEDAAAPAAVAAAPTAPAPAVAPVGGVLDGQTFVGQMGKKGDEKGKDDNFVFANGQFESTACEQYGFGTAPYTTLLTEEGGMTFDATTTSPSEGKMHWAGKINGDNVEGTAVGTKEGQEPVDYWFKGTLKKTEAAQEAPKQDDKMKAEPAPAQDDKMKAAPAPEKKW